MISSSMTITYYVCIKPEQYLLLTVHILSALTRLLYQTSRQRGGYEYPPSKTQSFLSVQQYVLWLTIARFVTVQWFVCGQQRYSIG